MLLSSKDTFIQKYLSQVWLISYSEVSSISLSADPSSPEVSSKVSWSTFCSVSSSNVSVFNCHLLTITVPRRPETLNSCSLAQVCFRYLYCTEVAMTGNIYLENYLCILWTRYATLPRFFVCKLIILRTLNRKTLSSLLSNSEGKNGKVSNFIRIKQWNNFNIPEPRY